MIVAAILDGLDVREEDFLLDLCCGNGALSTRIFARCRGGQGVDFSEELIRVAREHFEKPSRETYRLADVVEYLGTEAETDRFTKAYCYGSFQYLPQDKAERFLADLNRRFVGVERFYVGNLPDREKIREFYRGRAYCEGIEHVHNSDIGIWRTKDEFAKIAADAGWMVRFRTMPPEFFAAGYRYDALLYREGVGLDNEER
ncbi:MAG: class I SAM-dependent methyltransferase [Pseudodesulfovibrio sp.]|uniref:class I SAM-dependent methyltransferase n=1 Tax=Pseudodesulfovibrio sp. TaxID=2035812 RepID=UPI003D0D7A5E